MRPEYINSPERVKVKKRIKKRTEEVMDREKETLKKSGYKQVSWGKIELFRAGEI